MLKKDSGLVVINVTKWDRKGASRKDPQNCMIARAIKRELGLDFVSVHMDNIVFERESWDNLYAPVPIEPMYPKVSVLEMGGSSKPLTPEVFVKALQWMAQPYSFNRMFIDSRPMVPTPEICRQHLTYFDKGFGSGFSFTLRLPEKIAELVGA